MLNAVRAEGEHPTVCMKAGTERDHKYLLGSTVIPLQCSVSVHLVSSA